MAESDALREKVAAATGPDRELDAAVFNALVDDGGRIAFKVTNWSIQPGSRLSRYHDGWLYGKSETDEYADDLPRYTESIDAALALVEKLLPRWVVHMRTRDVPPGPWSEVDPNPFAELNEPVKTKYGDGIGIRAQVHGATLPLAILNALLTARALTRG